MTTAVIPVDFVVEQTGRRLAAPAPIAMLYKRKIGVGKEGVRRT
jgi:hypothetical protein